MYFSIPNQLRKLVKGLVPLFIVQSAVQYDRLYITIALHEGFAKPVFVL